MNKVIGLKLTDKDKKLINQIEDSKLSNSQLLRKALEHYFKTVNSVNQKVNQNQQEKNKQKVNLVNQKVNHVQQEKQEKLVNQVNPVQIIENHELIEYLKRNEEWLKNRIEHFEEIQSKMIDKIEIKPKKETELSWFRM